MEWAAEEALRCPGCGLPRDVSMRVGGDADFKAEPYQCHACQAKHERMKDWKGDNQAAIYLSVVDTKADSA